jgi:hypothetical protein
MFNSYTKTIDYTYGDDSRPIRPRFIANTKGGYLLILRLATIEVAVGETVLDKPPES